MNLLSNCINTHIINNYLFLNKICQYVNDEVAFDTVHHSIPLEITNIYKLSNYLNQSVNIIWDSSRKLKNN
jgi:hypothetical protein